MVDERLARLSLHTFWIPLTLKPVFTVHIAVIEIKWICSYIDFIHKGVTALCRTTLETSRSLIAREINIADNPPRCLLVCACITSHIGSGFAQMFLLFFKKMPVFHQIFFDFPIEHLANPPKISTLILETLWIGSPSGERGVRSSSECIKSFSSMKLVNFDTFLNFLFPQYNSPNNRKKINLMLWKFHIFLSIYGGGGNIALLA